MGESLVLKPLQSSLLGVDNLGFIRCSSVGSKQGSDNGINIGLKFQGTELKGAGEENVGSIMNCQVKLIPS